MLGDTEVENGGNATWAAGENVLTITVTADETHSTEYTVTVTKESPAQQEETPAPQEP